MGTKLFLYWLLNLHEWEETGNFGQLLLQTWFCQILDLFVTISSSLTACRYRRFVRIPWSHTESTPNDRRPAGRRLSEQALPELALPTCTQHT